MKRTILLVDDDAELREMLACLLAASGYAAFSAANAAEGLKLAKAQKPDLIVLDLLLPDQDGFTVCEKLRKHHSTARIPVIMLTGLTSQLSRVAGLDCGADDYVLKPVTAEEFLVRIQAFLGSPSPVPWPSRPQRRVPARAQSTEAPDPALTQRDEALVFA